jgi:hypothetical protein
MRNEKSTLNKIIEAKKDQRIRLPKKILFPSKFEKGIILKREKYMLNFTKFISKGNPMRYPTNAKKRLATIPHAAITPK